MRRTFIALALALATANPTAAQSTVVQPRPKCPIARLTVLGAAVGFGVGAIIAFPVPGVGKNVFEDTGNGTAPWVTLIGLTIVGAVIGNVLARNNCATTSPTITQSPVALLSETELDRLAHTVRLVPVPKTATDGHNQWIRPADSTAALFPSSGAQSAAADSPASFCSAFAPHP